VQDTSWIKPGKVAWDWWNANNVYGVDFKAGINTDTYKYYIDFAAKYGADKHGLPCIVVLDSTGKHLTTKDTGELEEGDHHSPEKVMAFLNQWSPKKS